MPDRNDYREIGGTRRGDGLVSNASALDESGQLYGSYASNLRGHVCRLWIYGIMSLAMISFLFASVLWLGGDGNRDGDGDGDESGNSQVRAQVKVGGRNNVDDAIVKSRVAELLAIARGRAGHSSDSSDSSHASRRDIRNYPAQYDSMSWPEFAWKDIPLAPGNEQLPLFAVEQAKKDPLTWCSANYGLEMRSFMDGDFSGAALESYMYSGVQDADVSYVDDVLFMSMQTPRMKKQGNNGMDMPEHITWIEDMRLKRGWMYIASQADCEIYTTTTLVGEALCNDVGSADNRFNLVNKTEITQAFAGANRNTLPRYFDNNVNASVETWQWTSPGASQEQKYIHSPKGTTLDLTVLRLNNSHFVYPLVHNLGNGAGFYGEMVYNFVATKFRPVKPNNYKLPLICRGVPAQDLDVIMGEVITNLPHDSKTVAEDHVSGKLYDYYGPGDSSDDDGVDGSKGHHKGKGMKKTETKLGANRLRQAKRAFAKKHCSSGNCDSKVWESMQNHPCPFVRMLVHVPL
eukprot:CAMPEP_0184693516 /NCGR_PEP_ID=MMETSP0313-20130426/1708_1 /TAXON_ID=2792 /ORGANISM="Porphyridium aerugineum, Strain SAG 1380-2" /LENGTH=516 /DNA_ID=CAMNT_0027151605 /DNA_START=186 /DNA_END=1739 /DNA_ORIENTATION=+